jgi:hypothetical protein
MPDEYVVGRAAADDDKKAWLLFAKQPCGGHLFEVRSEVFVRLPVHRRTTDAHCGQVRVAIFSFGKETA